MGKCSTCLIEVTPEINLHSFNRNEETTLLKAGIHHGIRLACQILIDENIDGIAQMVGFSRQSIISIEKGHYVPTSVLALKIAAVLKMNVEDLFVLEESDWN